MVVVVTADGMATANAIPQLAKLMYNFIFRLAPSVGRLLDGRRWLSGRLNGLKQLVTATTVARSVRASRLAVFPLSPATLPPQMTTASLLCPVPQRSLSDLLRAGPVPASDVRDKLGFGVGVCLDIDSSSVRRYGFCRFARCGPSSADNREEPRSRLGDGAWDSAGRPDRFREGVGGGFGGVGVLRVCRCCCRSSI